MIGHVGRHLTRILGLYTFALATLHIAIQI